MHYRRERPRFSNYFLFKDFVIFGFKFDGKKTDENLHYFDKFFLFCFQQLKNDVTERISLIAWGCQVFDLKTFATISDLRFLAIAFEIFA